ncbi:MAG: exodeoxyribonuclease V subunit alpha [Proteobacteria bacterium]|nr:exodeoxyribonuclease V subunit alpha [Pseudomonadota bacterium]
MKLETLRELGLLHVFDVHLARCLGRLAAEASDEVLLAAALASRRLREGHVCLDLAELEAGDQRGPGWPDLERWLSALRSSPLVGEPGDHTPLVLQQTRLYLARYWDFEQTVCKAIRQRVYAAAGTGHELAHAGQRAAALEDSLVRFFPAPPQGGDDQQRRAARTAARSSFCVITGGPGTGKTSTMVRLLAALVDHALGQGVEPPRVRLLAPTGKAAARMMQAVRAAKNSLQCDGAVLESVPDKASTIQRALGPFTDSRTTFRHDGEHPLPVDLAVVDEASMVDLALLAQLCSALPETASLVLLGDRNQLASVQAGAVLGDICGAGQHVESGPLSERIVELRRSYRYSERSGIAELARAIELGRAEDMLDVLRSDQWCDVELIQDQGAFGPALRARVLEGYAGCLRAQPVHDKLAAFERYRVLCAHRQGPYGAIALNSAIERLLQEHRLVSRSEGHYAGRPLMVSTNDYTTGLFNGDVGMVVSSPGGLLTFFDDGSSTGRLLSTARLPPHEPVFAMTVHKSQGSEFDRIEVVLPPAPSPVLSRELLYTAVTRARSRVSLYASVDSLVEAVRRPVARTSGLGAALWR